MNEENVLPDRDQKMYFVVWHWKLSMLLDWSVEHDKYSIEQHVHHKQVLKMFSLHLIVLVAVVVGNIVHHRLVLLHFQHRISIDIVVVVVVVEVVEVEVVDILNLDTYFYLHGSDNYLVVLFLLVYIEFELFYRHRIQFDRCKH